MVFYSKAAMRLFGEVVDRILPFFPDLKIELKRAGMRTSAREFLAECLFLSFVVFLFMLPLLSFIFAILFRTFLFSFVFSITASIFIFVIFFFTSINYPKTYIREKKNVIERDLPFHAIHLSTISQTKLPLPTVFKLFQRFSRGEIRNQVSSLVRDVDLFGFDINTALERAIERSPSKEFKDFLWGVLSTNLSGGDLKTYFKEKSRNLMEEYRRKLYEFSHKLSVFIEVYITAIVLGAIFFVVLTAILSGIVGTAGNIVILQFLLIVFFLPMISILFIVLVKSMSPGG